MSDPEIDALRLVTETLTGLDEASRARVLEYITKRFATPQRTHIDVIPTPFEPPLSPEPWWLRPRRAPWEEPQWTWTVTS